MAKRTHTLRVKNGEYQTSEGMKTRWVTVGSIIENDKGPMILLDRTFNPAGVTSSDDRDSIIVSAFKVDEEPKPRQSGNDDFGDSSIPF